MLTFLQLDLEVVVIVSIEVNGVVNVDTVVELEYPHVVYLTNWLSTISVIVAVL